LEKKSNFTFQTVFPVLITASARSSAVSNSRQTADLFKKELESKNITVITRDVANNPPPHLDETFCSAVFSQNPSNAEKERLVVSDELVAELKDVDYLLIATSMYNFNVPASLKLWLDHVARAGLTFNYENGKPVGHLGHVKGHVIMSSGGLPPGSPMDHVSVYLKQFFGFLGIQDRGLTFLGRGSSIEDVNVAEVVSKILE